MQLRELVYLLALEEEGTISGAAARLFMAQSSLSGFLKQYEEALGVQLFIRTAKGIKPTAAATEYLAKARQIVKEYELAQAELWDSEGLDSGFINFGISSYRGRYMAPKILSRFHQDFPKVVINMDEANSMSLEKKLLDGTLDVAILARPFVKLDDNLEHLMNDEILVTTSRDHPIKKYAHKKSERGWPWLRLEDIARFGLILSDFDTILGTISRELFYNTTVNLNVTYPNITAAMTKAMAQAGLGLGFTYASCIDDHDDMPYYSITKEGVYLPLYLAYSERVISRKIVREFTRIIKEELGQEV